MTPEIIQLINEAADRSAMKAVNELKRFLMSDEISKAEAARLLGKSQMTIHRWCKSGKMKETKSGKISREELLTLQK